MKKPLSSKAIAILLVATVCMACTTVSPTKKSKVTDSEHSILQKSCGIVSWYDQGLKDAGYTNSWRTRLIEHQARCEHIDQAAYMKGIKEKGSIQCTDGQLGSEADWQGLGVKDALAGKKIDSLDKYTGQCQEYEVSPDKLAYLRGFRQGILQLCTYNGGVSFGEKGGSYEATCELESEALFLKGYLVGMKKWRDDNSRR